LTSTVPSTLTFPTLVRLPAGVHRASGAASTFPVLARPREALAAQERGEELENLDAVLPDILSVELN
jgi:hypothetical protein